MPTDPIPTFDEWVRYCFTQGYADFNRPTHEGMERFSRFTSIPGDVLAHFMTRLFCDAVQLAVEYTSDQIADGVWFIFGGWQSGYFTSIRSKDVKPAQQAEVYESLGTMYTDCFDRMCNDQGRCPDENRVNSDHIDGAVYMIWDMDGVEGGLLYPGDNLSVVDAGFKAIDTALFRCRTSSCKYSALHGLGHLKHTHPERVMKMIERYLYLRGQPDDLREYANQARTGRIQ